MTLSLLQLNCNRSKVAMQLLTRTAKRMGADVLLMSEPNKALCGDGVYITDQDRDTAIRVFNSALAVEGRGHRKGHSWVTISGITLVSAYSSPNATRQEYEHFLAELNRTARASGRKGIVIGGDFNAKAREWSSPATDWRGNLVLDWTSASGLTLLNQGTTPIF